MNLTDPRAHLAEFSVGTVLSILQDQMLCHVDDLYDILTHVTGGSAGGGPVRSEELANRADLAQPFLEATFPALTLIAAAIPTFRETVPDWNALSNDQRREHITTWLDDHLIDYGRTVTVPRRPAGWTG